VPIDEVVPVDFYLPGARPIPTSSRRSPDAPRRVGTADPGEERLFRLHRKMRKKEKVEIQHGAVTADDAETCFLSQGVICLGSVTMNRCLSPCPRRAWRAAAAPGRPWIS